jgi:hypothetical protein
MGATFMHQFDVIWSAIQSLLLSLPTPEIYSIQVTSSTAKTLYLTLIGVTSPNRACCRHEGHLSASAALTNEGTNLWDKEQMIEMFSAHLYSNLITLVKNKIVGKKFWEELFVYFPLIRHGPHRKRRVQHFFYCFMCIPCRGNVFTEALRSKDMGYKYKNWWKVLVKFADEMSSGTMIYKPSFIKIGSGIQNLTGEGGTQTRQNGDRTNLLSLFIFKYGKQTKYG